MYAIIPKFLLWCRLRISYHIDRMDANSAPKKTFRSVQKRVVEEVKMSNESASGLGFHNLPFLVHRKSVKKGFEFTLMVVGEFV